MNEATREADRKLAKALSFLSWSSIIFADIAFVGVMFMPPKATILSYNHWDIGWMAWTAMGAGCAMMTLHFALMHSHSFRPQI